MRWVAGGKALPVTYGAGKINAAISNQRFMSYHSA